MVSDGVVTHSVRDTAAILDAIHGEMPGDPFVAPPPSRPYRGEVGAAPGKLRIGVMTQAPGGRFDLHAECIAASRRAAETLGKLGHAVTDGHPAALDEAEVDHHFTVMYSTHGARTQDAIGN